jgi:Holliday junction resolvase RusA-like endonuclease
MRIEFSVPGYALPWKRQGASGKFRWSDSRKMADHKHLIVIAARRAYGGRKPLTGPVRLSVAIFRAMPKAFSRKKRAEAISGLLRPDKRPDGSNQLKLIEDALNGVVWNDDAQVVDLQVSKFYAEEERTEIWIESMDKT